MLPPKIADGGPLAVATTIANDISQSLKKHYTFVDVNDPEPQQAWAKETVLAPYLWLEASPVSRNGLVLDVVRQLRPARSKRLLPHARL
jgi:hypothetical protein